MVSIGLDVGTGFVKCVSDYGSVIFPSLFAYRDMGKWEESQGRIEAVGKEAREFSKYPDAVIIRPVSEGRPIDQRGFEALVYEAINRVCRIGLQQNNLDNKYDSEISIIVGLPYDARKEKTRLRRIIENKIQLKKCGVVPQVAGTLIDMNKKDAIIMSIGQGTTEIVVFDDQDPIIGVSLPQATDFITQGLGEFSYLQASTFTKQNSEIRKNVAKLTDILSNKLFNIMCSLDEKNHYDVVVSGGGIMIPGMKISLQRKLKMEIQVPKIPIMSNAIGLHKLAKIE
ncbi:MAG: rod shape-determining protein [Nitrosopumilus sp.]|nr:rod shape-determining protein [Nitrosopumilus sp.]